LKLKPRSKTTNRKLNLIQYSVFRVLLESRCLKQGVQLKLVNPAYTSVIGKYKYAKRYGINSHTSAALVIARRGFYSAKERLPVQLTDILRRGEEQKFEKIFRYRHHWSAWNYLSKNLEKCLKYVIMIYGDSFNTGNNFRITEGINMNYLTSRFNPEKKSFLLRYHGFSANQETP